MLKCFLSLSFCADDLICGVLWASGLSLAFKPALYLPELLVPDRRVWPPPHPHQELGLPLSWRWLTGRALIVMLVHRAAARLASMSLPLDHPQTNVYIHTLGR